MNVAKFYHADGRVIRLRVSQPGNLMHLNRRHCIGYARRVMASKGFYQRGMRPRKARK